MQSLGDSQLWECWFALKYCACNGEHKCVEGQTINPSIVSLLLGSWVFVLGFFGGAFLVSAPFVLQEVWWSHFSTAVVGDSHTCLLLINWLSWSFFFTSPLRSPRLPPFVKNRARSFPLAKQTPPPTPPQHSRLLSFKINPFKTELAVSCLHPGPVREALTLKVNALLKSA